MTLGRHAGVNRQRHNFALKSPHDGQIIVRAGFMKISFCGGALALMLAAGLTVGLAVGLSSARAETAAPQDAAEQGTKDAAADKEDVPAEAAEAEDDDGMKEIDVSTLDWSQLDVDAYTLVHGLSPKPRSAALNPGESMSWSSNSRPNGASAVSVKQSVSSFWDTRVGADMTVAHEPTTMSELLADRANGGNPRQSSGAAWAAVTAPGAGAIWDKTSVEARVDPTQDQSKLGTTISKQVPITDQTSLTLENGANVTQQGVVTGPGVAARPSRNYDTEQSAKISNTDTGTSLTAGQTLSTGDDKWLRKIGAEQKVFGGVTVSGAVGETPQGATSKSISAGYKSNW
jgi:hypothetical protein